MFLYVVAKRHLSLIWTWGAFFDQFECSSRSFSSLSRRKPIWTKQNLNKRRTKMRLFLYICKVYEYSSEYMFDWASVLSYKMVFSYLLVHFNCSAWASRACRFNSGAWRAANTSPKNPTALRNLQRLLQQPGNHRFS